jgi:hypothetical protein
VNPGHLEALKDLALEQSSSAAASSAGDHSSLASSVDDASVVETPRLEFPP